MPKYISDDRALKKLGIRNWYEFSKINIPKFKKIEPLMDPDSVRLLIENVPEIRELSKEYLSTVEKGFESNDRSMSRLYDGFDKALESCSKQLDNENLSETERKDLLDQQYRILDMMCRKDSENKGFLYKFGAPLVGLVIGIGGGLWLGSRSSGKD